MNEAFQKKNDPRSLIEALGQQRTLGCSEAIIQKIARAAVCRTYSTNSRLIVENYDDNRLAFILSGRVHILVKGQKVAERASGQHVGEMSVIDPSARRSATVVAAEKTIVAWIEEAAFAKIAGAHPELWRTLAVELANRLRQRGALVRERNSVPEIFVGSSSESLNVAKIADRALKREPLKVRLWTRGVFDASQVTIESLEKLLPRTDFALLVLTADDRLRTRRKKHTAPRDNLIFELGLFMGAIGRNRTFMLVEKRQSLRLPPDLHGVTYLPLVTKNKKTVQKSVADAVSAIRDRISEISTR